MNIVNMDSKKSVFGINHLTIVPENFSENEQSDDENTKSS